MSNQPVKLGMAVADLTAAVTAFSEAHDPLEGIVSYFCQGNQQFLLVALDFTFMAFPTAFALRRRLAARCGVPVGCIVTHCTHTHTGPWDEQVCRAEAAICEALVLAAQTAKSRARPAELAVISVDTGQRINFNRRRSMPLGLRSLSVHMAYDVRDGKVDGAGLARTRVGQLRGERCDEPELQGPIWYDQPTDGLLQTLCFRGLDHSPIGTITRFAAHPASAGHTTHRRDSADYCGVLRRRMAAEFGGIGCFLTGPCGNLNMIEHGTWPAIEMPSEPSLAVPWSAQVEPAAAWTEMAREGNVLFDAIRAAWPPIMPFVELTDLDVTASSVALPMRPDHRFDLSYANEKKAQLVAQFERRRQTAGIAELRDLAEAISTWQANTFLQQWYQLSAAQYARGEVTVDTPVIRFNDVVLQGFPGETFWETAQPARQAAEAAGFQYMSFTECNGDVGYIPTEAERPGGGYEVYTSTVATGAEVALAAAAQDTVQRAIGSFA